MNAVRGMAQRIKLILPETETKITWPKDSQWKWLECAYKGHTLMIQYHPERGFGINNKKSAYSECPDEMCPKGIMSFEDVATKVASLLMTKGRARVRDDSPSGDLTTS